MVEKLKPLISVNNSCKNDAKAEPDLEDKKQLYAWRRLGDTRRCP